MSAGSLDFAIPSFRQEAGVCSGVGVQEAQIQSSQHCGMFLVVSSKARTESQGMALASFQEVLMEHAGIRGVLQGGRHKFHCKCLGQK